MPNIRPMNVGEMRKLIDGLPDGAPITPSWFSGPPSDHEPGVCLAGIERIDDKIVVYVELFYLGDDDAWDEEGDKE